MNMKTEHMRAYKYFIKAQLRILDSSRFAMSMMNISARAYEMTQLNKSQF